MSDKITTYGGVLIKDNDVYFDFSNSGVEFKTLQDVEITIEVEASDKLKEARMPSYAYVYLAFYCNDVLLNKIEYSPYSDQKTISFEANTKIKIVKISEAFTGIAKLKNLLNLPIQSVPKVEKKKIEFIGDSLTSGYGNDGNSEDIFSQDWTKTWGSHICKHFNLEAMVHSYSCMGLVKDSSHNYTEQINERRVRILGSDATTKFDFTTFKANYVVINIGTNDFGFGMSQSLKEQFSKKMINMINEIFEEYGNEVKIIFVHGPMMAEETRAYIASLPSLFKEEQKKNMYVLRVDLPRSGPKRYWGYVNHPTGIGHQEMANQLIPQLEKIFMN